MTLPPVAMDTALRRARGTALGKLLAPAVQRHFTVRLTGQPFATDAAMFTDPHCPDLSLADRTAVDLGAVLP